MKLPDYNHIRVQQPSSTYFPGGNGMARISKQELIRLQKKVTSDAAIGAKFGITRQAVHQLRQKYGIPAVKGKLDARNARILSLRKQGIRVAAVAKDMKLPISIVYRVIGLSNKAKPKVKARAKVKAKSKAKR